MDQQKMLHELVTAAQNAGVVIREGHLKDQQPMAQSGLVLLKGKPVIFLDKGLAVAERLQVMAQALRGMDLDNIYLSPAARLIVSSEE